MIISEIRRMHPDWDVEAYSEDWRHIVNCASCGRLLPYCATYTSHEQTTDHGVFGLGVCARCYGHEIQKLMRKSGIENDK